MYHLQKDEILLLKLRCECHLCILKIAQDQEDFFEGLRK